MDNSSFKSNTKPLPFKFCCSSVREISSAPAAVVAVPAINAPCCANAIAMAAPIPRLAPVTSATLSFNNNINLSLTH